jgi:hypothetical protein
MTVCRDPSCEPEAWTFGSTTGCIPIDSYQIATATTNATTVTAVCNTAAARPTNNRFGYVGTGAEVSAITNTYPGMTAFITASGCGLGVGQLYTRNIADTAWDPEFDSFGNGSDCSATNPALDGGVSREYTCLTISCCTTWGACGEGPIVVRVSGTFTINACKTLTLDVTENITSTLPAAGVADGAGASYIGGQGATPAESKASVIILAKTVAGTGTITATGNAGNAGGASTCCAPGSSSSSGTPGSSGAAGTAIGGKPLTAAGGGGGGTSGTGGAGGGATEAIGRYFNLSNLISQHEYGGAGGAGRAGSGTNNTGGGGGGGAGVSLSGGGNGGASTGNPAAAGAGGGGGGGGGGVSLILITNTVSAISICLTGGAGGAGGNSHAASGGGGGGGGGGGASLLLVATTDATCTTVTGGAGGTAGTSTGSCTSGANGSTGGSTAAYVTTSNWVEYIKRGF